MTEVVISTTVKEPAVPSIGRVAEILLGSVAAQAGLVQILRGRAPEDRH